MQKDRLKFIVGDIFPPDDIISQRIISLFMVFNDSMYVFKKMEEEGVSPTSEGNLLYLFRLHCSHLREAFKVLKDKEVKKIVDSFPDETKEKFSQLKKACEPVHKVLEKIRHNFFHYLEPKYIKSALEKIRNQESEISLKGDKIEGLYFKISDDVAAAALEEQTKGYGSIKEMMLFIAAVHGNLLSFINDFAQTYFETYAEGKYTEEKI